MTTLLFTQSAVSDLKRLEAFIAEHNPDAAQRISLRIRQAVGKLVLFPEIGRPVAELDNVRELVAGNYVVRYTHSQEQDQVIILRIWHGKEYR